MPSTHSNTLLPCSVPVMVAYFVLIAGMLSGLALLRQPVIETLSTPSAVGEWQEWRDSASKSKGTQGPVQRRVPETSEPPALILLRDYFVVCAGAFVLFGTILFAMMAIVVRGVFSTNVSPIEDRPG